MGQAASRVDCGPVRTLDEHLGAIHVLLELCAKLRICEAVGAQDDAPVLRNQVPDAFHHRKAHHSRPFSSLYSVRTPDNHPSVK